MFVEPLGGPAGDALFVGRANGERRMLVDGLAPESTAAATQIVPDLVRALAPVRPGLRVEEADLTAVPKAISRTRDPCHAPGRAATSHH